MLLAAESPANKRRSSVTDLNNLNMSGSFLDASDPRLLDGPADTAMVLVTPENSPSRGAVAASTPAFTFDPNKATARQQVFHEFVTTETNYVAVLKCISKMAEEAEDSSQQGRGAAERAGDEDHLRHVASNPQGALGDAAEAGGSRGEL